MSNSEIRRGIKFNGLLPSCSYSKKDFTDEKNSIFRFSRGYLICQDPDVEISPHFLPRSLGNEFYLYTHSRCRIEYGFCGGVTITIIGLAYFATRSSENENIAQTLAETFSYRGEDIFLDALDCLGGSYIVILQAGGKIEIYPDAATLRGVFYAPKEKVISSHVGLANLVVKGKPSRFCQYLKDKNLTLRTYYIDDSTPIEGIFRLIPDFKLSLDDFSTRRFYPRKSRKILDFESKLGGGGGNFFKSSGNCFKHFTLNSKISSL